MITAKHDEVKYKMKQSFHIEVGHGNPTAGRVLGEGKSQEFMHFHSQESNKNTKNRPM